MNLPPEGYEAGRLLIEAALRLLKAEEEAAAAERAAAVKEHEPSPGEERVDSANSIISQTAALSQAD